MMGDSDMGTEGSLILKVVWRLGVGVWAVEARFSDGPGVVIALALLGVDEDKARPIREWLRSIGVVEVGASRV